MWSGGREEFEDGQTTGIGGEDEVVCEGYIRRVDKE